MASVLIKGALKTHSCNDVSNIMIASINCKRSGTNIILAINSSNSQKTQLLILLLLVDLRNARPLMVLCKLGPRQLGPEQLGPGQLTPWQLGPCCWYWWMDGEDMTGWESKTWIQRASKDSMLKTWPIGSTRYGKLTLSYGVFPLHSKGAFNC